MTSNSTHEYQERLGEFSPDQPVSPPVQFDTPPIPTEQDKLELLNPIETLDVLRDPGSEVRQWLSFIRDQYTPPEHVDVLLLYPCAAEKPMPDSKTYRALASTLTQFSPEEQRRIHVVTVSEPMGLIPFEYQDASDPKWLYDNPGLFEWWVKNNDERWDTQAQQQCLRILSEHIAGFVERAVSNDWYSAEIACVRHMTAQLNESSDQTHRQMLERCESMTGHEFSWLPTEDVVDALVTGTGQMAWQMMGVSHDAIQTELASALETALQN